MIKFNESKNEKEKILEVVRMALNNPDYELECIFGNESIHDQNSQQDITNIITRIKGKRPFTKYETTDTLLMFLPSDSGFNKEISRVIVNGTHAINSLCSNESLAKVIGNTQFEKKGFISNKNASRVKIANYGFKFNLKREESIPRDSAIVKKLIAQFSKLKKYYRRKKTFTFTDESNEFKIDLSIVSQSGGREKVSYVLANKLTHFVIKPKEVRESFSDWWMSMIENRDEMVELYDNPTYYSTVKKSGILTNTNYRYEIELEYIGNKNKKFQRQIIEEGKDKKEVILQIARKMIIYITYIKQSIQGSHFILSKNNIISVSSNLKKLLGSERINCFPLAVDLQKNNIMKLNYHDYLSNTNEMNSNIRMDYMVTEKADGERNILYVDKDGKAYLVSRTSSNNYLVYTGLEMPDYANSIFDGELITKSIDGSNVFSLYLFDAYFIKGKSIVHQPFGTERDKNGRHIHIKQLEKYFNTSKNVMMEQEKNCLTIVSKKYYRGNVSGLKSRNDTEIFKACRTILSKVSVKYGGFLEEGHGFSYPIDGLIFIPLKLGVRQNYPGQEVRSIDGRWYANFKWKPSHHISIDFKLKFVKEPGSNKHSIVFSKDQQFARVALFSKVFKNIDAEKFLAFKLLNEGLNLNTIPTDYPFVPFNPYQGSRTNNGFIKDLTSMTHLLYQNNVIRCENGDIIEDGMTVECRYDMSKEDEFRWIPMRTRPDKKNSQNAIRTAFTTWRMMNNPITTPMITGQQEDIDSNVYYKESGDYFTGPLKKFNNFVKREIINRGLNNKNKARVLDLACGKMGDLAKFIANRVDSIIGIDISPDNLFNSENGGPIRVMNVGKQNTALAHKNLMKKTMLILGDVTKNIASGEAALDALNGYYLDVLYGRHKPEATGKLSRMYGAALNQFHLVNCEYAIHYFLDEEKHLQEFFTNVSQNLKDQCYFVGTCLDGKEVLKSMTNGVVEKFRDDEKGEKGDKSDKSIFRIETLEEADLSESGYGNQIRVMFETFYQPMVENLVDMDFLEEEALKFDLKLVDTKLFTEEPDSIFNMFQEARPQIHKMIEKSKTLQTWLGYQRWFIFQKVEGLSAQDDE
jgi:hypothetical protein